MNDQALSDSEIEAGVAKLNVAWSSIPGQGLVRVFETHSFGEGLIVVNQIASIVEKLNHHPEIILRPDEVEVTTVSHDAGGVTRRDLDLAEAIDELAI